VASGTGSLEGPRSGTLGSGDALALAPGPFVLAGSPGLRVLEVTASPAAAPTR